MVCAFGVTALAQVAGAPVPRSIRATLDAAAADEHPPTQTRGVVTTLWGAAFFIQEGGAGILVRQPRAAVVVRIGDEVEISGRVVAGSGSPQFIASKVVVLGTAPVPAHLSISAEEAASGRHDAQLVRIRGRVTAGGSRADRMILLEADGSLFTADAITPRDDVPWPELQPGATLEVSGVCVARGMRDHGPEPFRVLVASRAQAVVVAGPPWWMPPQLYRLVVFVGVCVTAGLFWLGLLRRQVRMQTQEIRAHFAKEAEIERRYRELFQGATDIVLTHDLAGRITSFNPAGERLLGWRADEIVGRNLTELLAPEQRGHAGGITARANRADESGPGAVFHTELLTRDGGRLPCEVSSWIECRDGQPVGMQAICRDVSERHRLEEERMRIERKLQESQKLECLGVLAGGIAHDFNNLLTGVLGNASLAQLDAEPGSAVAQCLDEIQRAAERAADLCKQMLAYSGKGRFVIQPIDLHALVTDITELLHASLPKKAVLDLRLDGDLPCVMGDATQLRQIIMNLVINAGEAIREDSGTITVTLGRSNPERAFFSDFQLAPPSMDGEFVALEVSDTGCGMNSETLARIFDPFFTTKFTGRGLGLAAVLGIVRGHSGGLKVASTPDRGSRFLLLLPGAGPMPEAEEATPFLPSPERRAAGLILLVDDEESVRNTARRILEAAGYAVVTAVDGVDALEKFRALRREIAGVVLDLTMPRMDGSETYRAMCRLEPGVRVLLMSGFAEQQAVARFAGRGLAAFLQKPFHPAALQEKLELTLSAASRERAASLV